MVPSRRRASLERLPCPTYPWKPGGSSSSAGRPTVSAPATPTSAGAALRNSAPDWARRLRAEQVKINLCNEGQPQELVVENPTSGGGTIEQVIDGIVSTRPFAAGGGVDSRAPSLRPQYGR